LLDLEIGKARETGKAHQADDVLLSKYGGTSSEE
jgi:hypothetical protein